MDRLFLTLGALLAAIGVAFGAFGAHALRSTLEPRMLEAWKTAVDYQLVHAIGVILIGVLLRSSSHDKGLVWAGSLLTVGTLFFSGSIYGLAAGVSALGPVTPVGGGLMLIGWLVLAIHCWRAQG